MSNLTEKVALSIENAKRESIPLPPLECLIDDREDEVGTAHHKIILMQAKAAIEAVIDEILSDDFVKEVSDNWQFSAFSAESFHFTRNALRAGVRKTMSDLPKKEKQNDNK